MTRPLWYAVIAYLLWGFFPLYWGLVRHVPTGQAMGHRIVWSAVLLAAVVLGSGRRRALSTVTGRVVTMYATAAVLVGVNWTIYIWAVNAGFVVETSLGYFILPLINVLLGVVVLRERLRRLQWVAVAIAAAGVAHLTRTYGAPPWIALGLAVTFGIYGLIKKQAPLPALEGLFLETIILAPVALLYLIVEQRSGSGMFLRTGAATDLLLIGTGLLTIVPLALFAAAVQRAPLSIVGILQYISPTIQFLIGILVFREAFSTAQFIGFAIVWCAIVLFAIDGLRARRQTLAAQAAMPG
jgi:chloramphenicol-sensitive protein RarD